MGEYKQMYINGEWVSAEGGESIQIVNPATGEVVGSAAFGDDRDAKKRLMPHMRRLEAGLA